MKHSASVTSLKSLWFVGIVHSLSDVIRNICFQCDLGLGWRMSKWGISGISIIIVIYLKPTLSYITHTHVMLQLHSICCVSHAIEKTITSCINTNHLLFVMLTYVVCLISPIWLYHTVNSMVNHMVSHMVSYMVSHVVSYVVSHVVIYMVSHMVIN